jgi:hypothetical protein
MVYCVDPDSNNANFLYCPSPMPSILFSVLFGLTAIAHVLQAFIFKKRFCWVIIMGTLWETLGFILRTLAIYNATNSGYAIASQLLILLSPLWINAFDYMVLGRMVYFFLPDQRIWGIRATRLTLIFVLLDIGSFLVQGAGGSMLSGNPSHSQEMLGIHICSFPSFFLLSSQLFSTCLLQIWVGSPSNNSLSSFSLASPPNSNTWLSVPTAPGAVKFGDHYFTHSTHH